MALRPRLELRQTQQLALTPQLREAISVLRMSTGELVEFVDLEIEKNPLLERDEAPLDGEAPGDAANHGPEESGDREESTSFETRPYDSAASAAAPSAGAPKPAGDGAGPSALENMVENMAEAPSLRAHLMAQISLVCSEGALREAAQILVDELDGDGFLRHDLDDLATAYGHARLDMDEALAIVQACEPTGVGARNLVECYRLQLAETDALDAQMTALLTSINAMPQLDLDELTEKSGLDGAVVSTLIDRLRRLDHAPGDRFTLSDVSYVTPDVLVTRQPNGEFSIEINPDALPRVLVSNDYRTTVGSDGSVDRDGETADFVTQCLSRANWLQRALDQRARTILKVAQEIVRRQHAFFEAGAEHLRGMTMAEVAQKIEMHESTVSRVASGKYLMCKFGTFEVKYFFASSRPGLAGAPAIASTGVQEKIRRMIADEGAGKILSDEKIAQRLRRDGIDVARRTVAKYREAISIPSSTVRRRLKAAKAR